MTPANRDEALSRRGALKLMILPVTALAAQRLLAACTDEESNGAEQSNSATGADVDSGVDAAAPESAASAVDSGETSEEGDIPWASGGTKAMQGDYPDPFAAGMMGTSCTLTKAMILGPCYAETLEREDISEGTSGVPMRLSLLVVRADGCTPVAGATVDVWHASVAGVYSEFGPGTTCNPGSDDLVEPKFCRGVQKTNGEGRVDFNSVIPGWYGGRAVHLHFTVRVDGDEYLTSQLFFDDALLDDIEQQTDYEARGKRDTRNTQDSLLPADDPRPYVLDTAKRADGALHAWKVIMLRSSLDEELPSTGVSFDFGDGGLPPGFGDGGFPGGGFPGGGAPGGPGGGGLPPLDGGI